jgi:hypothetical protein
LSAATRIAAIALFALAAGLVGAGMARAEFGPIELVSKSGGEQADEALAPAISADGRYLAFRGTLGGLRGIFREDLGSGAIVPVIAGDAYDVSSPGTDATAPSISADGRYVSFATRARLDADDDTNPSSPDVYVADMVSPSSPHYELASALDGCDPGDPSPHAACGLTYSGAGGAEASGRVALSADGRKIAFFTTAESDLTSGPGGSTEGTLTPRYQVVLRDLAAHRTTLVSVERDAATGATTARPVAGGALIALTSSVPILRGAALSADGTTVAWLGAHLPAQVPMAPAEEKTVAELDASNTPYDEPLWRRIADGPDAATRRVVGGVEGPFPGMASKAPDFDNVMGWLGPARDSTNIDGVPQLTADGRTVALIGNPTEATNVFVVDMHDGLSRTQAVRQLTREIVVDPSNPSGTINAEAYIPLNGHIFDLGISADGSRLAFATARQQFPLSPPTLIGSPPSALGLVELYRVDLVAGTLERASHGFAAVDEPSLAPFSNQSRAGGAGATAPSFGGNLIAFASTASNLVEADGNGASDAFVVEDRQSSRAAAETPISPGPGGRRLKRHWGLTLSARSLPDGSVRLVAVVPAAGKLRAGAGTQLEPGAKPRRLARARARARREGVVKMTLELPRRYRRLARRREGLYATAAVSFRHHGRKPLHGRVQVRFRLHRAGHRGHR